MCSSSCTTFTMEINERFGCAIPDRSLANVTTRRRSTLTGGLQSLCLLSTPEKNARKKQSRSTASPGKLRSPPPVENGQCSKRRACGVDVKSPHRNKALSNSDIPVENGHSSEKDGSLTSRSDDICERRKSSRKSILRPTSAPDTLDLCLPELPATPERSKVKRRVSFNAKDVVYQTRSRDASNKKKVSEENDDDVSTWLLNNGVRRSPRIMERHRSSLGSARSSTGGLDCVVRSFSERALVRRASRQWASSSQLSGANMEPSTPDRKSVPSASLITCSKRLSLPGGLTPKPSSALNCTSLTINEESDRRRSTNSQLPHHSVPQGINVFSTSTTHPVRTRPHNDLTRDLFQPEIVPSSPVRRSRRLSLGVRRLSMDSQR